MSKKKLFALPILMFSCLSGLTLTGCFDVEDDPNPSGNVNNRVKTLEWTCDDVVTIYLDQTFDLKANYTIVIEGELSDEVKFQNQRPNDIRILDGVAHPLRIGYSDITVYSVATPAIRDTFRLKVEERPSIESISFVEDSVEICVGTNYSLDADLTIISHGSASREITYVSSDPTVCRVAKFYDEELDYEYVGVEALKAGAVTITATSVFDPTKTDTFEVKASNPEVLGIKWHNYDIWVNTGNILELTDYLVWETRFNPSDREVYFTSESEEIGKITGTKLECLEEGEIYVDVYYKSNPSICDECILHITNPYGVTGITLSNNNLTYTLADSYFTVASLITVEYFGDIELIPVLDDYDLSVDSNDVIVRRGDTGAYFDIVGAGHAVITVISVYNPNVTAEIEVTVTSE